MGSGVSLALLPPNLESAPAPAPRVGVVAGTQGHETCLSMTLSEVGVDFASGMG
jgi:hypothetical protein